VIIIVGRRLSDRIQKRKATQERERLTTLEHLSIKLGAKFCTSAKEVKRCPLAVLSLCFKMEKEDLLLYCELGRCRGAIHQW
jgi:hypothetical protein